MRGRGVPLAPRQGPIRDRRDDTVRVARIVIVPDLAVRTYAVPAAAALRRRGHTVSLLRGLGWRGAPWDVDRYGRLLAADLEAKGERVDLLVGLSYGTQAAAVAAAHSERVGAVLLVSPTVDPRIRTVPALAWRWLVGDPHGDGPGKARSLPDWARAGLPRILAGFVAALHQRIEATLPAVSAPIAVVHAAWDNLGSLDWAHELARSVDARFVPLDQQPHSWPVGDEQRFADLGDELVHA